MKVMVTGATGFLGAWVVRQLLHEGVGVRAIKRESSALEELEGLDIEIVAGDVTDPESLIAATRGVDSVFHIAGLIAYSPVQRAAMERVNVQGTANVIAACQKNSVRRLVHMSSVAAIGASFDSQTLLNEESKFNLNHLNLGYFETKRAAEELVKAAVKKGELDAVILNPSTIYGAGDAKKGSRRTQLKVARGKMPFYTAGGVNVIAVEDVVQSTLAAWRVGKSGERYILAGENLLIKQVFEIIASEAGVRAPWFPLPSVIVRWAGRRGDRKLARGEKPNLTSENATASLLFHWFDAAKATRELGLKAKPARYAISQSISWSREHALLP